MDNDMKEIIAFINENTIFDLITILKNKKDKVAVMQQITDSRTAFQIKTQKLEWALEKFMDQYTVGMMLEAVADCMNNFRKGQMVEIVGINEVTKECHVDGVVWISEYWMRKCFVIVGIRSKE